VESGFVTLPDYRHCEKISIYCLPVFVMKVLLKNAEPDSLTGNSWTCRKCCQTSNQIYLHSIRHIRNLGKSIILNSIEYPLQNPVLVDAYFKSKKVYYFEIPGNVSNRSAPPKVCI